MYNINNVPDIYLESRDFQLFLRAIDFVQTGQRVENYKITQSYDPLRCDENLLQGISDIVGFRPRIPIPPEQLRIILKAFPDIYKYKGSRNAIKSAVKLGLFLQGKGLDVEMFTEARKTIVYISEEVKTDIMEEIVRHISPIGYQIEFEFGDKTIYLEKYGLENIKTETTESKKNISRIEEYYEIGDVINGSALEITDTKETAKGTIMVGEIIKDLGEDNG